MKSSISARLGLFLFAAVIGAVALPHEYLQLKFMASMLGGPLVVFLGHLGAVIAIIGFIGISGWWVLSPPGRERGKPVKPEQVGDNGTAEVERVARVTAELHRRKGAVTKG